jgi:quercetin dioxygenase-like cupin family protein
VSSERMIKKHGDGEALHVLGTEVRFLCPAANTKQAWSLMEVVLPKDAGPPLHHHPWDEAYYVIEGAVRFVVGHQVERAEAGDFVYAPGGTRHSFQGDSDRPARVLIFDAPAHAESFFREVDRLVTDLPRDMAKVADIGARHQIQFVQP